MFGAGVPRAVNSGPITATRGTPALHLNEPAWIIDEFNELIVDFPFALVIFLDSTQPCTLAEDMQLTKKYFWKPPQKYKKIQTIILTVKKNS